MRVLAFRIILKLYCKLCFKYLIVKNIVQGFQAEVVARSGVKVDLGKGKDPLEI